MHVRGAAGFALASPWWSRGRSSHSWAVGARSNHDAALRRGMGRPHRVTCSKRRSRWRWWIRRPRAVVAAHAMRPSLKYYAKMEPLFERWGCLNAVALGPPECCLIDSRIMTRQTLICLPSLSRLFHPTTLPGTA